MLTSCIFPFGLPKSNSFLFSGYRNHDAASGVAKVLKDLKEVLGEPESRSSNHADMLTPVGRHGNSYSSRQRVGVGGGGGKREFVIPPRTITPRVMGT